MAAKTGSDHKKDSHQHTSLHVEAGSASATDCKRMGSSPAHNASAVTLTSVLPKWWKIGKLWFTGEERWVARGYAASVIGLALVTTLFSVHISYAQRDFSTALSGKDVAGFYAAVRKFVVIICVAAPLFSFNAFVEERLVLAWRANLTRRLTRAYFANRAFYHLRQRADSYESGGGAAAGAGASAGNRQRSSLEGASGGSGGGGAGGGSLDNPDQRICDDVASFVRASVSLSLTVCRKVFSCVAFAGVLWGVSGHLVFFMFVYAGVGTFVTTAMFGRILTSLFYRLLAREADLRFSLVRVRENAESIAFYRGEADERSRVLSRLSAVLGVAAERIRWSALYDLWTSVYSYATILVPSLLTAPRYFAGEIEFGVISQASFAFSRIDAALSVIINNLTLITGLAAGTDRLDALVSAMAGCAGEDGGMEQDAADGGAAAVAAATLRLCTAGGSDVIVRRTVPALRGLVLQRLRVVTPRGPAGAGGAQLLAADLSLHLEPGQSLLIVGASGCGKSSLLRAIAGLWMAGSGTVVLPAAAAAAATAGPAGLSGEKEEGDQGGGGAAAAGGGGGGGVFFLPQKPFMPLGDLRAQLCFPGGVAGPPGGDSAAAEGPVSSTAAASTAGIFRLRSLTGPSSAADPDEEGAPLLAGNGAASGSGEGGGSAAALALPAATKSASALTTTTASPSVPHAASSSCSDEELLALLDDVCLPDLVKRVGGLDVELDWSAVLSVGEQQRVAVLRLLRAAPALAFLDEATSALDGPTEARLYGLIRKRVGCYVSVGHRMQLLGHHSHVLEALGGGQWRLSSAQDYQRRLAASTGLHP